MLSDDQRGFGAVTRHSLQDTVGSRWVATYSWVADWVQTSEIARVLGGLSCLSRACSRASAC